MPAFASSRSQAWGLPCSIRYGSTPASPNETNRARGSSPSSDALRSLATSTPAAPSQIWLELPAREVPLIGDRLGGDSLRHDLPALEELVREVAAVRAHRHARHHLHAA